MQKDTKMNIQKTALSGVFLIKPPRFEDVRGFFSESWNHRTLTSNGIDVDFVQDNHSLSTEAGTIRGLHFQAPPYAQTKLVRCGQGALLDVAVDIRRGSPTYGKYVAYELSAKNGLQLLVPSGYAHGFLTLTDNTEIIYKCDDYYAPNADGGVRWDSCGIDWGFVGSPILSGKDTAAPILAELDSPFTWEG